MFKLKILITVCTLFLPLSTFATPILDIQGGILVGARDVVVGGSLFDVAFKDGTCAENFNGCDENSDFLFNMTDAVLASQALLDQVFLDGPLGAFDSAPINIFRGNSVISVGLTPYEYRVQGAANLVLVARSTNYNPMNITNASDSAGTGGGFALPNTIAGARYWAVWTPATSQIPEPSTITLFLISLSGFAMARRRIRRETLI